MAAYAWLPSAGSMVRPWTNRLGKAESRVSWCHVPPALVAIPRVNPLLLQGPHHETYAVPFCIDTAVAECPAPRSNTFVSADLSRAAHNFEAVSTYWPPKMARSGLPPSRPMGAMNRAFGSPGSSDHEVAVPWLTVEFGLV